MTSQNEPVETQKKLRTHGKGIGILLSTFGVIIILCLMFYVYYYFITLNHTLMSVVSNSQNRITTLEEQMVNTQNLINQALTEMTDLQKNIQTLTQSVRQLSENSALQAHEVVDDAHFFVKLANENLEFKRLPRAIFLLKKADAMIQSLADPAFVNLHSVISQDIDTLEKIPVIDLGGTYVQLNTINSKLNELPLRNPTHPVNKMEAQNNSSLSWWGRGLQNTWQELRNIVVIRNTSKEPFVSPNQAQFLYENLHAYIMHAMWGLLNGNMIVYENSLQGAILIIKEYFATDSNVTIVVLNDLETLAKINVNPEMPDVTNSLSAFSALKQ